MGATLDPDGEFSFLSDGNVDFARGAGLSSVERSLFLGECYKRFSMIVRNALIEKLAVEETMSTLSGIRLVTFLD